MQISYSSKETQINIESKLERWRKTLLGAPVNKTAWVHSIPVFNVFPLLASDIPRAALKALRNVFR